MVTISKALAMLPEAREKTTCHGGGRVRGEKVGRTGHQVRPRVSPLPSQALCSVRAFGKGALDIEVMAPFKTCAAGPPRQRRTCGRFLGASSRSALMAWGPEEWV